MAFWSRRKPESDAIEPAPLPRPPEEIEREARGQLDSLRAHLGALDQHKAGTGFEDLAASGVFSEMIAAHCRDAMGAGMRLAHLLIETCATGFLGSDSEAIMKLRDLSVFDTRLAMELSETLEMAGHIKGSGNAIDRRVLVIFWRERTVDLEALAKIAASRLAA